MPTGIVVEKSKLPNESNVGLNDCGVFSAYFCARVFDSIPKYPDSIVEMREALGKRMNDSAGDPSLAEMMNPAALKCSADYLVSEGNVVQKWEDRFPLQIFAQALERNSVIMLLVNASHYIIVTGYDNENVVIYDPNDSSDTKIVSRQKIMQSWALQNNSILPDGQVLSLREAIIVSKK